MKIATKAEALHASISDGSGNRYELRTVLLKAKTYGPGHITYIPMQTENSSSGTYSGGKAFDRELSTAQSSKIWAALLLLQSKSTIHVQARSMGTSRILYTSEIGSENFLIKDGPDFDALIRLLRDEN